MTDSDRCGQKENRDDHPPCVDDAGHAWVSGRAKPTDEGIEMLSRQCRRCGYEDEF